MEKCIGWQSETRYSLSNSRKTSWNGVVLDPHPHCQLFLINLRGSLALVDVFLNMKVEICMGVQRKQVLGAKDYSMNLGLGRRYGTGDAYSVGAWEHGIYICNDSTF